MMSCFRCGVMKRKCPYCQSEYIIKSGFTSQNKQRFKCNECNKKFLFFYSYRACISGLNNKIITLTKEGLGIRSTARVLRISTTTLLKRIISIANNISKPIIPLGKEYEVDEIRTFIKRKDKHIWIVYALEKTSRKVVSFYVGSRTNKTLNVVLKSLNFAKAKHIFTDRLKQYKYLIDDKIHKTIRFGTNHIERKNLTLRTHLKRLNRRTICFSRSYRILNSLLKIYFWNEKQLIYC